MKCLSNLLHILFLFYNKSTRGLTSSVKDFCALAHALHK